MQGPVDPAGFIYTIEISCPRVVKACLQLSEGYFIRRIAINLIRTHKNEHSFRAMLPRRFEQVQSSQRIHLEIEQWNLAGLVVGWLGCAMHNQVESVLAKYILNGGSVPNIDVIVGKILRCDLQTLQIPLSVTRGTKKHPAHIIIDADDHVSLPIKIFNCLRPDQSTAAGNENRFGSHRSFRYLFLPANLLTDPSSAAAFYCAEYQECLLYEDSTYGAEGEWHQAKETTGAFAAMLAPTAMHLAVFASSVPANTIYS